MLYTYQRFRSAAVTVTQFTLALLRFRAATQDVIRSGARNVLIRSAVGNSRV